MQLAEDHGARPHRPQLAMLVPGSTVRFDRLDLGLVGLRVSLEGGKHGGAGNCRTSDRLRISRLACQGEGFLHRTQCFIEVSHRP